MTETTTTNGEKLRSPGPETTREESALRRFGSAVTRLVTKGLRADRGTNRGAETMQPSSSDRAGVDYPDASEEKLDEKTLQIIEKIGLFALILAVLVTILYRIAILILQVPLPVAITNQ